MTDKDLDKKIDKRIEIVFTKLATNVDNLTTKVNSLDREIKAQGKTLNRIDRILLGDKEYDDEGFLRMIKSSYEYTRKNTESEITRRGWEAIDHYERWKKEEKWDALNTIIDDNFISKRIKIFFNLGSWAGIIGLITSLIALISLLKNSGVF